MSQITSFYDTDKTNNYRPTNFFNLMRIIAILIICCIYHVKKDIIFYPDNPIFVFFQTPGKSAIFVEMFFVISGFLFFTVYFNRFMSGKLKIGDFIKKKVWSFYPIIIITTLYLYFLFSINYLITGNVIDDEDLSPFRLLISLFFGSPNSLCNFPAGYNLPLWFLFALMIILVVACFVTGVVIKHKDNNRYICLYLLPIAIGLIMYGLMRSEHPLVFWNEDIPHGLVSFFIGFYTGLYIKRYEKFSIKKKNLIRVAAIIWLVFFVVLTIRTNSEIPVLDMCLSFSVLFWPPLIVLCYDIKWLNIVSGIRPIKFLALISLFMFVLNYPIIKTIKVFGGFDYLQSIEGWIVILILVLVHVFFAIIWYVCDLKIRKIKLFK